MKTLKQINSGIHVSKLNSEQAKELQTALNFHGYNLKVDGIVGNLTTNAFVDFKHSKFLQYPEFIGPTTVQVLLKDYKEEKPSKYDFSTKQSTIGAIIQECKKQGLNLNSQIAYVLATVDWETNKTFKPVKEAYWLSENWRKKNLRYYPFYG